MNPADPRRPRRSPSPRRSADAVPFPSRGRALTRSAVAAAVLAAGALVLTAAPAVARQPAPPAGPPSSQQRPPSVAPGGARPAPATGAEQLVVAADGRSLETVSGAPFFWLGDTAWSLVVNLDRDEVVHYLDDRAAKGFTVIQAVAVSPPSGGLGPSALGDVPFVDDLGEPLVTEGSDPGDAEAYDYWDHVAFVLDEAAARGMYVALLPAWGRSVAGEELDQGNAQAYGEFLGERFGDRTNIVWMMGGDDSDNFRPELWGAVARGITTAVAGSEPLMTFHPGGGSNSATALDDEPWLDLHTYQSSHTPIEDSDTVWRNLERSYAVDPPKPFLDSEPAYEAHPIAFDAANGYTDDTDVRRIAWISVFSGAAGHTYGHHNIWMMYGSHRGGKGAAPRDIDWREALDAPGGAQMAHLAALMAEHPAPREPAQDAIRSATFDGEAAAIRAVRAADNSYLLVYSGAGEPFQLDPADVPEGARATWLDPRTGERTPADAVATRETTGFDPPTAGEDWVLVLDAPRAAGPAARAGTARDPASGLAPPARGTPPGPSGPTPRTPAAAPARPRGEPVRILPLGDSITYGYSHGSYRTALYEQLTDAGVEFDFVGGENDGPDDLPDADHEGHSGWRVDEIAERAAGWVAEHEPDVVLLHIGTNDLIQDTPPDQIAVRLDRLLHTLVTTRPGTAVVVATLIPLNGGSPELDEYNDAVRALAAEYARRGHPVRLADMAAAGIGGERDIPDRVHPSPTGYAKMADVWLPEVTAVAGETA